MYIWVAKAKCFAECETESTDITNPVTQDGFFVLYNTNVPEMESDKKQTKFSKTKAKGKQRKNHDDQTKWTLSPKYIYVDKTLFILASYCFSHALRMMLKFLHCSPCDCHDPLNVSMHSWKKLYDDALMPPALLPFALHVPLSLCVRVSLLSVSYYLAIFHRLLYFA